MNKGRLEAFSDSVIAIIITIMVLELRPPHHADAASLAPLAGKFVSYVLSFIYLGIYWNNHHHMLQAVRQVNGPVLMANLHLLFWLSLVPFVTAWAGETHFSPVPVALYGLVLLCAALAYFLLSRVLIAHHGAESVLGRAMGSDRKGRLSIGIYMIAILVALPVPLAACALYVAVAIIWLVPDRRIEKALAE